MIGSEQERDDADGGYDEFGNRDGTISGPLLAEQTLEKAPEVKITGKATRFKPLSVSNKKSIKKAKPGNGSDSSAVANKMESTKTTDELKFEGKSPSPAVKVKRSLFSLQQEENDIPAEISSDSYESTSESVIKKTFEPPTATATITSAAPAAVSSLEAVAADLNLTPAQRRQLFGRHSKDVNVTHFNMDSEYAANEQLRWSGETIEHKAVKTIAPGKHSLQQLVNNARSNQESIEEKWAEGRRNRGEGGSKYGWSR